MGQSRRLWEEEDGAALRWPLLFGLGRGGGGGGRARARPCLSGLAVVRPTCQADFILYGEKRAKVLEEQRTTDLAWVDDDF